MTPPRAIAAALARAGAAAEPVVLATVVHVVGSSYGGVGARMLVRADGTTAGIVSGGCLEGDLAAHARAALDANAPRLVRYDTRADDGIAWGLGVGCNGLIDVLVEPLVGAPAEALATLLTRAMDGDAPAVLATVVRVPDESAAMPDETPALGARALLRGDVVETIGGWGDGRALAAATALAADALAAGRRGMLAACAGADVAFEVVVPVPRLVVCGSGPDARPVADAALSLGWDVTVVDHRPAAHLRPDHFPGARVVSCDDADRLSHAVALGPRTAAVVMSHHFGRDAAYVRSLLASTTAYVGVLGPRARTERMLAEEHVAPDARLFGPVGLDVGGDGPEAIALAVVAEASAVLGGRRGGHLRDRATIHDPRGDEPRPPSSHR